MPLRIRPGRAHDLAAIDQVEREAAQRFLPADLPATLAPPLPAAQVAAAIAAEQVWAAEDSEAGLVGFILCERPLPACLHVREMDVLPAFGRQGIGSRLLEHACVAAAAWGLQCVTLTTFAHVPWNAPFYAKRRFDVVTDLTGLAYLAAELDTAAGLGFKNRVAMRRPID